MILLTLLVCLPPVLGFIMPMKNGNGEVDISSIVSHITLLEQRQKDSYAKIASLESEVKVIESIQKELVGNSTGGATYTRWGRTSCPTGSKLVYEGYTGGTNFQNKASASTILCLPAHPIYAEYDNAKHDYGTYIHGTEYETTNSGVKSFQKLQDQDVPCAVCYTPTKTTAIMVPARNQCLPGWDLEYWGYLMGPRDDYASGEYICVDSEPEEIPGGQYNKDGQLLYVVGSVCTPLACPPYKNYAELTCAVCSK